MRARRISVCTLQDRRPSATEPPVGIGPGSKEPRDGFWAAEYSTKTIGVSCFDVGAGCYQLCDYVTGRTGVYPRRRPSRASHHHILEQGIRGG